jgi:hyperosmotically inducible protein
MTSRFAMSVIVLALAVAPLPGYAADKAAEKKEGMIPRVKEITEDSTITGKIKAEFAKDKAVSALGINVDTSKGVVTLSGNAKSREEAEKAVAIAKSTAGVSSVKNEIKITSSGKK